MRATAPIKSAKIVYIVMSVSFIAFGIILLCMPSMSERIIGITLGVLMAAFGAAKLAGYFSKDLFRLAFRYDLQLGIAALVIGIVIAACPERALYVVCVAFGASELVDGLFKVTTAFEAKKFGIAPWAAILAWAIVSCIIGVLLVIFPSVWVKAAVTVLGIAMIAEGCSNLVTVLTTVKIIKHQQPDVIDVDYEVID